jgi:transposase-like protein
MGFERLAKEIKRRVKVIEVFLDEGSVERSLYLILKDQNERLNLRRLSGFNEIELEDSMPLPEKFLHN